MTSRIPYTDERQERPMTAPATPVIFELLRIAHQCEE